jgi:hypothetical protein
MGSSHGIKCSAPGNGDYFGVSSSGVIVAGRALASQDPDIKDKDARWASATATDRMRSGPLRH